MNAKTQQLEKMLANDGRGCECFSERALSAARAELAQLRADLQAAQQRIAALEAENARGISLLRGMLHGWTEYAKGHYCQTYNTGMAEGLECAAIALEAFLDGWEKSLSATNTPAVTPE